MTRPRLAKLSRPRLFGIQPRERVFTLLDRRRRHQVIWLSASPGAGKTAVVASYLESRKVPGIWCQLDSDDSDPANFFYYLGLTAPRKPRPLPPLTPEYLPTLSAFARRWFRQLFAQLPAGSVVVLDNYQDVSAGSSLQDALANALEEIPSDANVVVISREDPPAAFARLVAHASLVVVGWQDLQLSVEETALIAAGGGVRDRASLQALHERSNGWAAGLTLLLERPSDADERGNAVCGRSLETVFDYFTGQIFDHAPAEMRELLLRTAFVQHVSVALAEELTGNDSAGELLESLYRRHLFIDRRDGVERTYHYHALFREFLRTRAHAILGASAIASLLSRAAKLAEAAGLTDDAFALHAENNDWESAARVLIDAAEPMLRQGRGRVLRDWIGRLPEQTRRSTPWTCYWESASLIPEHPVAARSQLELVFQQFRAGNDMAGQAAAAAGVVETYYYEWSNFRPLDRWVNVLGCLLTGDTCALSPELELRSVAAYVFALSRRQPAHPDLPASMERTLRLLEMPLDVNQRVIAGTILINHYHWLPDFKAPSRLLALIKPILNEPALTPLNLSLWLSRFAFWQWRVQAYDRARATVEEGIALALKNGLENPLAWLYFGRHLVLSHISDVAQMERNLRQIEAVADPSRSVDAYQLAIARTDLAVRAGDLRSAEHHLSSMIDVVDRGGALFHQVRARVWLAAVKAQHEDPAGAWQRSHEVRTLLIGSPFRFLLQECLLVEAFLLYRQGAIEEGASLLGEVLRDKEAVAGLNDFVLCGRGLLARLCESAIRAGIENETTHELVGQYRLAPGERNTEHWPWPLKVHALGSFSVLRMGAPLTGKGKSPTKLLQLLKILVASGDSELSGTAVAALLWPDADGDAAQQNLDNALLRLRTLLGLKSAVVLRDNKLRLDRAQCWVDAWAFEDAVRHARSLAGAALIEAANKALALYHGHFLAQDDEGWALPYREHLRQMLVELVQSAGDACLQAGRWEQAAQFYNGGLSLESLSEPLYRKLMLLHRQRGEPAEAVQVYRRCRETLSALLGTPPSAETQALYASLHG